MDPFKQGCITDVCIFMRTSLFDETKYWYATIEFKNGKTKGEQRFGNYKPDEFDKMIDEIKQFTDSLSK